MNSPGGAQFRWGPIGVLADLVRRIGLGHGPGASVDELRDFCDGSKGALDIVVLAPANLRHLQGHLATVFLDADAIDRYQVETNYPIGAFDPAAGSRLAQSLARKISKRLAALTSPQSSDEHKALAAAWFFVLWAQVCTLLPMRHLARQLSPTVRDKLVLIPLDSDRIDCLDYWTRNELEPFILGAELKRRGARVLFVATSRTLAWRFRRGSPKLSFVASSAWHSRYAEKIPSRATAKLFVKLGLRNGPTVGSRIGQAAEVGVATARKIDADVLLWGSAANPNAVEMPLSRSFKTPGYEIFSAAVKSPGLLDGFLGLLGPISKAAWLNAKKNGCRDRRPRSAHQRPPLF